MSAETEPKWLMLARGMIGTREVPGPGNNPSVVDFYAEAGHAEIKQDAVPWCAAFVGAMVKRAGIAPSGSLMARSYLKWGKAVTRPTPGCIVVLKRGAPPAGHVGFFLSQTPTTIKVLGGNQSDAVTIATFNKSSVLGYRSPK